MQQLSDDHIQSLYIFTRQHFVEFYDLQTELVDHMANGIERQWEKHPGITFEQARDREFKKFGVFGFMHVVEQRQKAMGRKYGKMVWYHFVDYMKVPKVLSLSLAVLLTYFVLKYSTISDELFVGAIIGLALLFIAAIFIRRRQLKIKKEENEKKWLFKEIIYNQGAIGGFAILLMHFFNIFNGIEDISLMHNLWIVALSIFICSFYLFLYIMAIEIPKRAEEYLMQTYPEYDLV